MGEEAIRTELSKATNLMQLVQASANLKRQGADEHLVNKVLSEVRRSLVSRASEIKKIPRKEFPGIPNEQVSYLAFNVRDLSNPSITLDNGVFVL